MCPLKRYVSLALFLALVLGGGLGIGFLTVPGAWYAELEKPSFNPPSQLFGPVWTVVYVLIAVAGWRIWISAPRSAPMKLWWTQLVLNFLWSPAFFGAHQIGLALLIVLILLLGLVAFIAVAWQRDRVAALLFVPYAGWVAFASTLNASIWLLN